MEEMNDSAPMYIWVVTPTAEALNYLEYDTFRGVVVRARTEQEARGTHPASGRQIDWANVKPWSTWVHQPDHLIVEKVDVADEGSRPGVLLSNFHHG
jgi:hypothetical protein